MTEKEKAAQGMLYNANYDQELIAERMRCKMLCYTYNNLSPVETDKRKELIAELFNKTGSQLTIESPFACDYGYHIKVGENFFMNHNGVILDGAPVVFGDNVFVAPNCGFYTAGHPLNVKQRNEGLEYAKPIRVGNNVWIGGNVVVLPGVCIGDNTVIGAGSVVNKDIPSGVVAAGNPCKVIRKLTEEESCATLSK